MKITSVKRTRRVAVSGTPRGTVYTVYLTGPCPRVVRNYPFPGRLGVKRTTSFSLPVGLTVRQRRHQLTPSTGHASSSAKQAADSRAGEAKPAGGADGCVEVPSRSEELDCVARRTHGRRPTCW